MSENLQNTVNRSTIIGSILGTAVGDALGLPYEALSPRRAAKLLGKADRYRFLFGFGMISDDSEHTAMVAQSLIVAKQDVKIFQKEFSWQLRLWLICLPAGVGWATLRAVIKLWLGFSPNSSGVFSAGNAPAMRAAILGAAIDDLEELKSFVKASARITHKDPKAEYGALTVAFAARMATTKIDISAQDFFQQLKPLLVGEGEELINLIEQAVKSVEKQEPTIDFAKNLGLAKGVSGYVYHTVPVAIHAWLSNQKDFSKAVTQIIECGGDADSTAAIVGGIVGARVGKEGIPKDLLENLFEWPRSTKWLENLAIELSNSLNSTQPRKLLRLPIYQVLLRNIFFIIIILLHGLRRLFPPY
ncbi:MAG: ADP-ribosylglycohydrolase family protein [Blastocatellia bacterium]